MRLAEYCEPVLQYVCRLSRSARKGVSLELAQVRSDLRALLGDIAARTRDDPKRSGYYERVRLALTVFVDETVGERIPMRGEWSPIADDAEGRQVEARVFFDELEDALGDPSPSGLERVELLHDCLGLGFAGGRTPGELDDYLRRTSERLRAEMDADPGARVCPEAYDHLDTSDLIQPATRSVTGIVVVLVVLLVAVLVGNALIYRAASGDLQRAIDDILRAMGGG